MLQVYWDRVEEMGRWSIGTLQWRLNRRILLQHQSNWDRGWLQFRAQGEAAKLWVREGIPVIGIASWHIRVLEQEARRLIHTQVQQEWAQTDELDRPARVTSREMGSRFGAERAGRGRYKRGTRRCS